MPGSRTPRKKTTSKRKGAASVLSARVNSQVTLEVYATGKVGAYVDGYAIELGTISAGTVQRAQGLAK